MTLFIEFLKKCIPALLLSLTLLLTACGHTPQVAVDQSQIEEVRALNGSLSELRQRGAHLYAPNRFEELLAAYQEIVRTPSPEQAARRADATLAELEEFQIMVEAQQTRLRPVPDARARALDAGADKLATEQLADADQRLKFLGDLLENAPSASISEDVRALAETYQAVEAEAVIEKHLGNVRRQIRQADYEPTSVHAPISLARAKTKLDNSITTLLKSPDSPALAQQLADEALHQLQSAEAVASEVKHYRNSRATLEEVLLDQRQNLQLAAAPVITNLSYHDGAEAAAQEVASTLENLLAERLSLKQALTAAEQRESDLRQTSAANLESLQQELEQRLLALQLETDAAKRKEQEARQRLRYVEELFSLTEAEVFQQGNNLLIRAHGFVFAPGSADVEEANLSLLNKIMDAIDAFPNSRIQISGHTDSSGDAERNQILSLQRAESVQQVLVNGGGVSPERISVEGVGSARPVATNDSATGRAANRRVEILLVN